jgi:hypothetical protein
MQFAVPSQVIAVAIAVVFARLAGVGAIHALRRAQGARLDARHVDG